MTRRRRSVAPLPATVIAAAPPEHVGHIARYLNPSAVADEYFLGSGHVSFRVGVFLYQLAVQLLHPLALPLILMTHGINFARNMSFLPVDGRGIGQTLFDSVFVGALVASNCLYFLFSIHGISIYEVFALNWLVFSQRFAIAVKYAYMPPKTYSDFQVELQHPSRLSDELLLNGWNKPRDGAWKSLVQDSAMRQGPYTLARMFRVRPLTLPTVRHILQRTTEVAEQEVAGESRVWRSLRISDCGEVPLAYVAMDIARKSEAKLSTTRLLNRLILMTIVPVLRALLPVFIRFIEGVPPFGASSLEQFQCVLVLAVSILMGRALYGFACVGVLDFQRRALYMEEMSKLCRVSGDFLYRSLAHPPSSPTRTESKEPPLTIVVRTEPSQTGGSTRKSSSQVQSAETVAGAQPSTALSAWSDSGSLSGVVRNSSAAPFVFTPRARSNNTRTGDRVSPAAVLPLSSLASMASLPPPPASSQSTTHHSGNEGSAPLQWVHGGPSVASATAATHSSHFFSGPGHSKGFSDGYGGGSNSSTSSASTAAGDAVATTTGTEVHHKASAGAAAISVCATQQLWHQQQRNTDTTLAVDHFSSPHDLPLPKRQMLGHSPMSVRRNNVAQRLVAVDALTELFITFRSPQNIQAWMETRDVLLRLGIRFQLRVQMYAMFLMVCVIVENVWAISLFTSVSTSSTAQQQPAAAATDVLTQGTSWLTVAIQAAFDTVCLLLPLLLMVFFGDRANSRSRHHVTLLDRHRLLFLDEIADLEEQLRRSSCTAAASSTSANATNNADGQQPTSASELRGTISLLSRCCTLLRTAAHLVEVQDKSEPLTIFGLRASNALTKSLFAVSASVLSLVVRLYPGASSSSSG